MDSLIPLPPTISLEYPSNQNTDEICNIILIDNSVKNYNVFVNNVNSKTLPIVYSRLSSKTELLKILQNKFTIIKRISFVFSSNLEVCPFFLNYKPLFLSNEAIPYSENVEFIINIIKKINEQTARR